ncbi:MAG TPA: erythromycin esterase family protein [Bacteroidia bacterium]|nr:erythromycin esterase family protein [Bacteroidia bacterium]
MRTRGGNKWNEEMPGKQEAADFICECAHGLENASGLDALMEAIGDAQYVLLGEASHGTHEYYTWRTHITRRLIAEKNFSFVAVEGDWPDCYRLNRYVKGYADAGNSAKEVLQEFNRWPTWMWANWETVALAEWLHKFNRNQAPGRKAGFYGLDVYSLWESIEAIIKYLERTDRVAAEAARKAVRCFDSFGHDEGRSYAQAAALIPASCEEEVTDLLATVRRGMKHYNTDPEGALNAEQNAVVAVHAEHYYRTMMKGGISSWNVRDHHMTETLERLVNFHGTGSKAIVWEHNTHIGDARATAMSAGGMVNVGQLLNEKYGSRKVFRVGFGSYSGSVIAGKEWGEKMERMNVPRAMEGSWEELLHRTGMTVFYLLTESLKKKHFFREALGHRAIGVVYHPEYEQHGNYVPSIIPLRYEAFVFIDQTKALHPLHVPASESQVPETYPWGI